MTDLSPVIQKIAIIIYTPIILFVILFGIIFSTEVIKEYIRERSAEKKNRVQQN